MSKQLTKNELVALNAKLADECAKLRARVAQLEADQARRATPFAQRIELRRRMAQAYMAAHPDARSVSADEAQRWYTANH